MSVLVYIENIEGNFRKPSFEIISFGFALAQKLNLPLVALSIGKVSDDELKLAGKYGASRVLNAGNEKLSVLSEEAYASVIAQAAKQEDAKVIIMSSSFAGKSIAPRVAVKLDASIGENVVDLPETGGSFIIRKGAFSGKAFAFVELLSDVKVLSVMPNSYKVVENPVQPELSVFEPQLRDEDFRIKVLEVKRATDKVSLPDAELVVSAGRGLKGPENWGMIEELAEVLGAATACSKPVSDSGWRPHSEHVGQTGIAISPNLYIAVGISGAIQHLAGVSNSKVIVVVNKDPEAPFFKAADYGIVGDAFEVIPKLIEAAKAFKASQN
ncbi:MAG: electron transfer flavoprotein subunit alpha/FixB family protein [Bacteroidetes bacterium]|nr:MAG: electron transfer flavoprotein subunit alpha/FixB family protein [Bacteroidota bacterium]REK00412.1 MAG: electron transfer flavoprotein subunit alpha/FixB family protein [Bacteroidota bacterium]REK05080.1 MAG: electron transfer flavoprotein subunit alpha/FixB family protein [Bacteroidota bacterium]REK35531.1 MAG: electron transfer flavoprotein subunit alpha/FixB family protein [Bacteroidota bacterium]